MPAGVPVLRGRLIADVKGGKGVTGVELTDHTQISCDAVAMSGGWSPIVNLACHRGAKPQWDERIARLRAARCGRRLSSPRARPRASMLLSECLADGAQGRHAEGQGAGRSEMPRRGLRHHARCGG